ncbi:MAG: hypothetical protein RL094_721 [Candidatus Parcubacteria bacterium]|jgi:ATP-binding cassette subfamily B protein
MQKGPSVFSLIKDYKFLVLGSLVFSIIVSSMNLILPQLIKQGIDSYTNNALDLQNLSIKFFTIGILILVFMYVEALMQNYVGERVARDLRQKISRKISVQSYGYVAKETPGKLLTNLTSDIDAIKQFIAQASVQIAVSLFAIVGASILLLGINWKLGLAVLCILPIIGYIFFFSFSKIGPLFGRSQGVIDNLNTTISGSIFGAALIRVLNSRKVEEGKFVGINAQARDIGLNITKLFSRLIPNIFLVANAATVAILALGGYFVIGGSMTLGEFAAFNAYISVLLFPVFIIGFMSSIIGQASASYARVIGVIEAKDEPQIDGIKTPIEGNVEAKNVSLTIDDKLILKDVSLSIKKGKRVAIIGPTAAGKTQLMYLLIGLTQPDKGEVLYDGINITKYDKDAFYGELGFVFQDSVMFNLNLRENISFSKKATDESLQKAIDTSELHDFVSTLPEGLETLVSERGTTLSGGQKQRVMLARALAQNPKVLLLDDFTARVDGQTEAKIIENIAQNYPDVTLISVSQKISSVEKYDQIILLMEGEVIAQGTHTELLKTSPEYVQIYESQKSTTTYEL